MAEYLAIAGAVLTERLLPVDGTVTARGPDSSWVGTSMRSRATPSRDGATNAFAAARTAIRGAAEYYFVPS